MYYYLDGYNLLFTLADSKHTLASQRQSMIRFLQKHFALHKMDGLLVFDGRVRRGEESGRSYPSPLEVVYTPKGQSADAYILEQIELSKHPRQTTVVTNDRGLGLHARALGAKTMDTAAFVQWLTKRKRKKTSLKPEIVETKQNLERLLRLFEEKLKDQ